MRGKKKRSGTLNDMLLTQRSEELILLTFETYFLSAILADSPHVSDDESLFFAFGDNKHVG